MGTDSEKSKVKRFALYLGLMFFFILGVLYVTFVWVPKLAVQAQREEAGRVFNDVRAALSKVFNIEPESRDRTVSFHITETASIYELSTVSRKFTHTYMYSTKWMGSTKSIHLVGEYEAKAGIDLTTPLKVSVSPNGRVISIQLPKAKLTSLTTLEEGAVTEKNGYWNRVSSEDKEIALKALRKDAERVLAEGDLLKQAEERCFEQIKARLEAGVVDPGVVIRTVEWLD